MKRKKAIWVIFSIAMIPLVCYSVFEIYSHLYNYKNIDLALIGQCILMFELLLASITAFNENGHFPIRYLLIFIISALIFYLALNKSILEWYSLLVYVFSIVILSISYIYIKILNKKYSLSEDLDNHI